MAIGVQNSCNLLTITGICHRKGVTVRGRCIQDLKESIRKKGMKGAPRTERIVIWLNSGPFLWFKYKIGIIIGPRHCCYLWVRGGSIELICGSGRYRIFENYGKIKKATGSTVVRRENVPWHGRLKAQLAKGLIGWKQRGRVIHSFTHLAKCHWAYVPHRQRITEIKAKNSLPWWSWKPAQLNT